MVEEKDGQYRLLENNANAVRAVMSAVEGTIGPKGLDTMLVDQFGEVIITNDGVTILNLMEVSHPIVRMIINAIRAQQEEVGDGTTTATLMAGEMVLSGLEQIQKGVPVAQVTEGLRFGIKDACRMIESMSIPGDALAREQLFHIALVAGREHRDIAQLVVDGLEMIGTEKLQEADFKLSDMVKAVEGAESAVFLGVMVTKEPLDAQMPLCLRGEVKILVVDDALEAEAFDDEALATESGFKAYLSVKERFREGLQSIIDSGAQAVFVDRGVADLAEEMLGEAGIMVVSRVPNKELRDLAEHTGARMIKRTGLNKPLAELVANLGRAEEVVANKKLKHIKVMGGHGKAMATVLVGASTGEIVGERERIAKDAASSVQVAMKNGLVAGGGALELAVARVLETKKNDLPGMASFGVDCVISGLKRPFMQIVSNAGFNPLEKLGDVNKAQVALENAYLAIDCDTGKVVDLLERGVVDPTFVKIHGLKVAGEVAEAILRINIIIKKKEYQSQS